LGIEDAKSRFGMSAFAKNHRCLNFAIGLLVFIPTLSISCVEMTV
jgi:hypothetical protein